MPKSERWRADGRVGIWHSTQRGMPVPQARRKVLAGRGGFEPPSSTCLYAHSGSCVVHREGVSGLQKRYQRCALPTELPARVIKDRSASRRSDLHYSGSSRTKPRRTRKSLVDLAGVEPATSNLRSSRYYHLSYRPKNSPGGRSETRAGRNGAGDGIRTRNSDLGKVVLCH